MGSATDADDEGYDVDVAATTVTPRATEPPYDGVDNDCDDTARTDGSGHRHLLRRGGPLGPDGVSLQRDHPWRPGELRLCSGTWGAT